MAMIGKVRRMYYRQKKSVREIVRTTSLSRNTIRKSYIPHIGSGIKSNGTYLSR